VVHSRRPAALAPCVSTFVELSTHTVVSGGTASLSRSRRWTSVSASPPSHAAGRRS
jgi:hypothetical protein